MSKGSTRTQCIPSAPHYIVILAFAIAPTVLVLPISYFGYRESLSLKPKSLQIIYWITSVLLSIAILLWPFHEFCDFEFSGLCTNWDRIVWTNISALFCYMASLVCICGVYSVRMVSSFQSSKYSTSIHTILFFLLGIFIQSVLVVLCIYSNYMARYSFFHQQFDELLIWHWRLFMIFNVFGAVNMLYNIILLITFLYKVYQMSGSIDDSAADERLHSSPSLVVDNIIRPAAIYALCLCIAFVSTSVVFIWGLIRGNLVVDSNALYLTNTAYVCWDIFINIATLNLQFDAAKPLVHKYCSCWVDCLMRLFMKKMMNRDVPLKVVQHRTDASTIVSSNLITYTTGNTTGTSRPTSTLETFMNATYAGESCFHGETVSFITESRSQSTKQQRYFVNLSEYERECLVHGFVKRYYRHFVPFAVTKCIFKLFENHMVMMVHLEGSFVNVFRSMFGCNLSTEMARNVIEYYDENGYEWKHIIDDCQTNCHCMYTVYETLSSNDVVLSDSKKKELRQSLQRMIRK